MHSHALRIPWTVAAICSLLAATAAFAGFSGTDVFLPSVGAKPGISPAIWYTTVWVHNPNATVANVTFYLLERQANPAPVSFSDTIQPGDTAKYDNAIELMFAKQTFGAVRVTSNVKILASSRIFSQSGELKDSVGQLFAGTPASFAIGSGQSTELLGVYGTLPSADSTFRYNFGFVETTGTGTCTVKVTVKGPTGAPLGDKTYNVRQWEQVQKGFKDEFPALSTQNARLTAEVTAGTGKVIAFGSGVANGSLDPATFEMAFRDELLAENATGGGITAVTAGAGLSGGGTSGAVALDVGAGAGITVDANTVSIADSGVTSAKIADLAVATADLANGSVTTGKLSPSGGANGKVLKHNGSAVVWGDDQAGGLTLPYHGEASTGANVIEIFNTSVSGGRAIYAESHGTTIWGKSTSTSGDAKAVVGTAAAGFGLYGESATGRAVQGLGGGDVAVYGRVSSSAGSGVYGKHESTGNYGYLGSLSQGVYGHNATNDSEGYIAGQKGVYGYSVNSYGMEAKSANVAGLYAEGKTEGVKGFARGTSGTVYGVRGWTTSENSIGVHGFTNNYGGKGIYGQRTSTGFAGYFDGPVTINGTLNNSASTMTLDHPLAPEGMVLSHAAVVSPDLKTVYDGTVVLDAEGVAWVELPPYFEALNRDFRYQLTAIGAPAPGLHVAERVHSNRFKVAGGVPGIEVCWQITGIRQDRYATAHPMVVEEDKPEAERGTYLHPAEWGQPEEKGVEWVRNPDLQQWAREQSTAMTRPEDEKK